MAEPSTCVEPPAHRPLAPEPSTAAVAIDYDGRAFRPVGNDPAGESGRRATYHQNGTLLHGEFAGGDCVAGRLLGNTCPDGTLLFCYMALTTDGVLVSGLCRSVPTLLEDGRVHLTETWQRYLPEPDSGQSELMEVLPA